MKNIPRISDTEWEVMRLIWAKHPAPANEIIEQLIATDASWHPKTARTLLARLVQKQALGYEVHGRAYVYSPLVSEQECLATASKSFLEQFFGGSLKPMLAHFVGQERLSRKELEELRELLAETNGEKRKNGRKPWKR